MSSNLINPKIVYYIKLGKHGAYEKDCIEVSQTIKLGFGQIPHELCLDGKWDEVKNLCYEIYNDLGTATRIKDQIQYFYESDEKVLWVTFFGDRLYWCFSKPDITFLPDKDKSRPVIGKWSSKDINGKSLQKIHMSGGLLRTQGFRGTICKVKEEKYLIEKINGIVHPEIENALHAKDEYEKKIEILIRKLTWQDFEVLLDLLFRQVGWQRNGILGKTQKTIDIDLYSPVTDERFLVQVKSSANLSKFESFRKDITDFQDYDRAYFVVHTPSDDLVECERQDDVELWLPNDIARRVVLTGLSEWVINKIT